MPGCGGQTLPYVDDAGVYHAADGAVVFAPGTACVGWDASHLNDPPPSCATDSGFSFSAACPPWSAGLTPPGYPGGVALCEYDQGSVDGSAHCASFIDDAGDFPTCPSPDTEGNQFCVAWAQQFVVNGKAFSGCVQGLSGDLRCVLGGYLDTGGKFTGECTTNATEIYVATEAGNVCERACEP